MTINIEAAKLLISKLEGPMPRRFTWEFTAQIGPDDADPYGPGGCGSVGCALGLCATDAELQKVFGIFPVRDACGAPRVNMFNNEQGHPVDGAVTVGRVLGLTRNEARDVFFGDYPSYEEVRGPGQFSPHRVAEALRQACGLKET